MTNKRGELLDIAGLDTLRKVSRNRVVNEQTSKPEQARSYIDIDISHVFEWTHLLYLPDYPVYKEDIWFKTMPVHVPGLPTDQPILTKFTYRLLDFRQVGTRKVAVIDMNGVAEWNLEWTDRTSKFLTEFKSWGNMGITSRYWFDYQNGEIFAIERPPFIDWQYQREYTPTTRALPYNGLFAMTYPGLIVTLEMFYNTRLTDISGKPKLREEEPQVQRRYVVLNMFCQLEAE